VYDHVRSSSEEKVGKVEKVGKTKKVGKVEKSRKHPVSVLHKVNGWHTRGSTGADLTGRFVVESTAGSLDGLSKLV
jgi:hypothetical protein